MHWIKTRKRLPNEGCAVLIVLEIPDCIERPICIAWYYKQRGKINWYSDHDPEADPLNHLGKITHWRELPKLPKRY